MRMMISFAALFAAVALFQLGAGGLGPLDALAGLEKGFTTFQIGLLGSAHFVGFFLGCWLTPRMMGSVGHSRAFAAMAALGAVAALAHPLAPEAWVWVFLRMVNGLSVAGAYTIIESWFQAKVSNASRGRVLGVYRVVDMTASVAAQTLVAVLPTDGYVAYNVLAALFCFCLLPMTLTRSAPPPAPRAPRLRPSMVFRVSPLAGVAVLTVGLTNSSFRMVGPVYATGAGLDVEGVALFMAAGVGGGALAQWPAGWLSDRYDRRRVLTGLSLAAICVCLTVAMGFGDGVVYLAAFAFGAAAFPLFSIAAAHANDFTDPEEMVELNASIMFAYGLGAIVSPLAAAELIATFGPPALFLYVAAAHGALMLFALWRATRRPAAQDKTRHFYLPRTSFIVGRLFKGGRK